MTKCCLHSPYCKTLEHLQQKLPALSPCKQQNDSSLPQGQPAQNSEIPMINRQNRGTRQPALRSLGKKLQWLPYKGPGRNSLRLCNMKKQTLIGKGGIVVIYIQYSIYQYYIIYITYICLHFYNCLQFITLYNVNSID